jgi:hypothetical protein
VIHMNKTLLSFSQCPLVLSESRLIDMATLAHD